MEEKFYAVWRKNGYTPNKKHQTKEDAIQEANRLAKKENDSYYILEAIGISKPIEILIEYIEIK